jgi:hypothetical protein
MTARQASVLAMSSGAVSSAVTKTLTASGEVVARSSSDPMKNA